MTNHLFKLHLEMFNQKTNKQITICLLCNNNSFYTKNFKLSKFEYTVNKIVCRMHNILYFVVLPWQFIIIFTKRLK